MLYLLFLSFFILLDGFLPGKEQAIMLFTHVVKIDELSFLSRLVSGVESLDLIDQYLVFLTLEQTIIIFAFHSYQTTKMLT